MNTKLVSVIMPAYNCEKFIKQAIDSILNQTYTNFELLIADDGSKDSTKKIIDSYTDVRIKRFHNQVNLGYTQTSNKLFIKCLGDYITFQDADDFSSDNRLEILVNLLDKNEEITCVGSNIYKVNEEGFELSKSNYVLNYDDLKNQFKNSRIVMTGSALMVRKEIIETIGYYNLFFDRIGAEDVYWFSLILSRYKVCNVTDALYYYRVNTNSVTSSFKNPKTTVLHNFIVFLYNQRELGMEDYLQSNNVKKADIVCEYLLLLERVTFNKIVAIFKFVSLILVWPSIGFFFYRDFLYKLIKHKK